ncbi:MAG: HAD family hydrolase [Candidatus Thorarchaeota archaeon]|jgi:HAD superfamily hydrolase (TIGR01549 family)
MGRIDMKIEGIKALIFDLGGTLYKPVSDMCSLTRDFLIEAGIERGHSLTDSDIVAATQDPDKWLSDLMIEKRVGLHWVPGYEEWIEYDKILLSHFGIDDIDTVKRYQAKWDEFQKTARPELIEGCKAGLKELQGRGFKLGVASNRFGDPTEILSQDSILDLFDTVEYTNVPGYRKPSPYMLIRVAQILGINPNRCAYVGNVVKFDVEAASRAGMVPVLITWIDPQEVELITSDTVVIDHIDDLMEIL